MLPVRRRSSSGKTTFFIVITINALVAVSFLQKNLRVGAPCPKSSDQDSLVVNSSTTEQSSNLKDKGDSTTDPYSLARSQSFGFFYDITNEHWKLWQQTFVEHENHKYPEKPLMFNPQALPHQVDAKIHSVRSGPHNSYAAWYQNVREDENILNDFLYPLCHYFL